MKLINAIKFIGNVGLLILSQSVTAHPNDDPLLTKVMIDQLEAREAEEDSVNILEGQFWIGQDWQKLWFKTDVEQHKGETEEFELQALYSRAIAPFWDMQFGLRQDFKTESKKKWAVLGVQGLAPYYFAVDAALFVGEEGHSAARLSTEYEIMLTQRWVLSPEAELNFFGQNESSDKIGSGLSTAELGLRLRFEIRREFAPYIGVNWSKKFGDTAQYARDAAEAIKNSEWVIGVSAWF